MKSVSFQTDSETVCLSPDPHKVALNCALSLFFSRSGHMYTRLYFLSVQLSPDTLGFLFCLVLQSQNKKINENVTC